MTKNELLMIENFDRFANYIYPIASNFSHKHRMLKEKLLNSILEQYRLFYEAIMSNQISKFYIADSGISFIKSFLRFASNNSRKLISLRQYEFASSLLNDSEICLKKRIESGARKGRILSIF